jgi:hypothetical protein
MPNDDWVFWLNVTNIALGLVVVLAVLVTAYGLVWELVIRHKKPAGQAGLDKELNAMWQDEFDHSLSMPELGMTMADGGERRKPAPTQPTQKKRS